jgi:hypothetical protein
MSKEDSKRKKNYSNMKVIQLDPLGERLSDVGFMGGASKSMTTRKFLKEGIKKYPKTIIKSPIKGKVLSKENIKSANLFRKAKITEHTIHGLHNVARNIFLKNKIKKPEHLYRADKMGKKILKDQKKLKTYINVLKSKDSTKN